MSDYHRRAIASVFLWLLVLCTFIVSVGGVQDGKNKSSHLQWNARLIYAVIICVLLFICNLVYISVIWSVYQRLTSTVAVANIKTPQKKAETEEITFSSLETHYNIACLLAWSFVVYCIIF